MKYPFVALGDLVTRAGGLAGSESDLAVYSVTKHRGFVPSLEYFDKQVYSRDLSRYKRIEEGDFAYATIHLDEGSIGIAPEPCLISPMYTVFAPDAHRVHAPYLLRFLKSPGTLKQYPRFGKGSVERRRSIKLESLSALQVPLPPLPEQRRIAEILDRADALRAKRRQAITKLDSLTQSIFIDMFKVNGQTPLKPLDQIIDRIVVGHVGPTSEHFRDTGIPFLRTGNIGSKSVTSRDLKFISADFHRKLAKSQLRKGDVIISRVISDEVRCAVVPSEFDGANCANVVIVRPGRQTSAEYLANLIRQPASQRAFMQRKVGSAQGVVNTRTMASWLVPSPPLDEQRRFEARARAILSVLESMETSADSCDALFASLQHRAFSGQL